MAAFFLPTSSQIPRADFFEFSGYGRFFLCQQVLKLQGLIFLNSAAMAAFLCQQVLKLQGLIFQIQWLWPLL